MASISHRDFRKRTERVLNCEMGNFKPLQPGEGTPDAKACPRCGKVTNLHASVCENCGRAFKTQFERKTEAFAMPAAPGKPKGKAGWIVAAIVFLFVWLIGDGLSKKPDKISACTAAKAYVKNSLTSPSSADMPPCSDVQVTDLGNGRFLCEGTLDADNAFGAHLRQSWACTVRFVKVYDYRCEYVRVGDNETGTPPTSSQ